jgi:hypothetical protein
MKRVVWGYLLANIVVSRAGLAQPVPSAPTEGASSVAAEQHPIRAGGVKAAPAPAATPKRRWYGLPILITDAAAYGSLAVALNTGANLSYTLPSLAGYAIGGPIIHGIKGQWGHAGLSLLTRAALPMGGALMGADCSSDNRTEWDNQRYGNCEDSIAVFVIVGMVAATAIDLGALSWEDVEPAPSLQPVLSAGKDAAWIGASGTF